MQPFRRRLFSAAVAVLLLPVVLAGLEVQAQTVHANEPHGPADDIRIVDLRCSDGMLDLNHADPSNLGEVLELSGPIVQRLIDHRPHYDLSDALVVAGVGPGRYEKLRATTRTCATPLALPPLVPSTVCQSGQTDLAVADIDQLTNVLSSKPAAQRLIDRRNSFPLPTLNHALIVAGIGSGKVKQLEGTICLTPAPFHAVDAAGFAVDYEYIYGRFGGVIEASDTNDTYQLSVPAGTILADGSWGRVTVVPPPDEIADWPRAEMHLEEPFRGTVHATLPRDHVDAALGLPTHLQFVHHLGDGSVDIHDDTSLGSLLVAPSTVTAPLTSLSFMESYVAPTFNAIYDTTRWARGKFIGTPSCNDLWPVSHGGSLSVVGAPVDPVAAYGPALKYCVGTTNGEPTVRFTDAYQLMLTIVNETGDPSSPSLERKPFADSLFTSAVSGLASLSNPTIGPGGQIDVSVDLHDAPHITTNEVIWRSSYASFNVDVHAVATIAALIGDIGIEPLLQKAEDWLDARGGAGEFLEEVIDPEFYNAAECLFGLGGSSGFSELIQNAGSLVRNCIPGLVDELEDAFIEAASGIADPTDVQEFMRRWGASVSLSGVTRHADNPKVTLAQVIIEAGSYAVELASLLSSGDLVAITHMAPRPEFDPDGYPINSDCITSTADTWRLNRSCQTAYITGILNPGDGDGDGDPSTPPTRPIPNAVIVRSGPAELSGQPEGTAHVVWRTNDGTWLIQHIETPQQYICWARTLPVRWDVDLYEYVLDQENTSVLHTPCDDNILPARNLTPPLDQQYLIRATNGTLWLASVDGTLDPIDNEQMFDCVLTHLPGVDLVWDWVSQSELAAFDVGQPFLYQWGSGPRDYCGTSGF
jgi:hypothetical protein